jgi:NADH-quinone oxidoreductase subunit F
MVQGLVYRTGGTKLYGVSGRVKAEYGELLLGIMMRELLKNMPVEMADGFRFRGALPR